MWLQIGAKITYELYHTLCKHVRDAVHGIMHQLYENFLNIDSPLHLSRFFENLIFLLH